MLFMLTTLSDFESFFISAELITSLVFVFFIFRKKNFFFSRKECEEGFECGFDSFSKERMGFCVRFIKLAILFLLIDLEISLLLPFFQKGLLYVILGDKYLISLIVILVIILLILLLEWAGGGVKWREEI